MDLNRKDWILIQRYIIGKASASERVRINRWMNKDLKNKKLVQELKDIWALTPSEDFQVDIEVAWKKFHSNRVKPKQDRRNEILKQAERKVSRMPVFYLLAAAVVLVTMFTAYFVQHTFLGDDQAAVDSDFFVMQTFETEKGEKASVSFSDGSRVMLNSGSSLRFPEEFKGSKREVFLEGEGYFIIAHNPRHPFIVYNQNIEIMVLGTEFNVQGWSEEGSSEVVVREGKVSVSLQSDEQVKDEPEKVVVTGGQYIKVQSDSAPTSPRKVNVNSYLFWTHGGLYFEDTPFRKVIRDIERRFDVQISGVEEELMEVHYTGTFQYAELDEVLSVLAVSMDLEVERVGLEITFK